MKDPYELLGVPRDASWEEIQAAYARLSADPSEDQAALTVAYQALKPMPGMDQPGPLFAPRRPEDPGRIYARLVPLGMSFVVLGLAFLVLFHGDSSLSWRLRGWMPESGPMFGAGLIAAGGLMMWLALGAGRDRDRPRTLQEHIEDEVLGRDPDDDLS